MTREELNIFEDIILEKYHKEDICMWEFLAQMKPAPNMTFADCMQVYCDLLNYTDGDEFIRIVEDEEENLVTGERKKLNYVD